MKTTIEILVDGKVSLTVPADIRADGTIWSDTNAGTQPIINGHLLTAAGITKEQYGNAARAGELTDAMLACCLKLGENPGGRVARDKETFAREQDARREAAMSPIEREKRTLREAIHHAERRAARCDRSEDDVEFDQLSWKAERLQKEFYERFPEELRADRASNLRGRADHKRALAIGALVYDCDGSLSDEDQQRRHDEFIAEAVALESKAAELEGSGAA